MSWTERVETVHRTGGSAQRARGGGARSGAGRMKGEGTLEISASGVDVGMQWGGTRREGQRVRWRERHIGEGRGC